MSSAEPFGMTACMAASISACRPALATPRAGGAAAAADVGTGAAARVGAGMIVGIILLILIVLVLVVYAGPKIFVSPTAPKSLIDLLQAIAA